MGVLCKDVLLPCCHVTTRSFSSVGYVDVGGHAEVVLIGWECWRKRYCLLLEVCSHVLCPSFGVQDYIIFSVTMRGWGGMGWGGGGGG